MISCSQPLAAAAGLEILQAGGNAADAAVAVSAVLGLTEPTSCGMGGDAFCLFYDARTKEVKALNGSGRSPKALSLTKARELGLKGTEIPLKNLNSFVSIISPESVGLTEVCRVTVPGCAAAWVDTIEQLGSGKITVAQALNPAILLAEAGYVLPPSLRAHTDMYDATGLPSRRSRPTRGSEHKRISSRSLPRATRCSSSTPRLVPSTLPLLEKSSRTLRSVRV
jgi:gamma-glutamyltranspeptidase